MCSGVCHHVCQKSLQRLQFRYSYYIWYKYLPTNERRISTFQANIPRASFRSYKSIFSGFSITRRMKDTQKNFRKSKYLMDDADDHQSNHVLAPLALSREILASSKMRCILIKLLAIWKALESPLNCPYFRYFLGLPF